MEQKRLFLAVTLSIGVLMIWQYFFLPDAELTQQGNGDSQAAQTDQNQGDTGKQGDRPDSNVPSAPAAKANAAKTIAEKDVSWDASSFKATFTNKGGRLKAYSLKDPEQYAARGDLVRPAPDEEGKQDVGQEYLKYLSFATTFAGRSVQVPEDALYEVKEESEKHIVFRYTDPQGRFVLDKTFTLDTERPYAFDLDVNLQNTQGSGSLDDELSLSFYTFGREGEEPSMLNPVSDNVEGICSVDNDVERAPLDDAADRPRYNGSVTWGGVDSRYFMTVALPDGEAMKECQAEAISNRFIRSTMRSDTFRVEANQSRKWSFKGYVGPKKTELMESYNAGLENSIDYGIVAVICKPVHWLLIFFQGIVGNWGLAIILLTFVLRMLMFPINHKSYKNMEGMRRLQEPVAELKKKYENDPAKMQQEMMEMYRKEGVSPFGCLPTLLQMPIFFALYRTVYNSVELYQAEFVGWYTDLSVPDPYYILPILVGVLMFGQQALMPNAAADSNPQMKMMMYVMPVMFSAFTFMMPSGLALYMFVSFILGIGQQFYIRRSINKSKPAAA